MKTVAVEIEVEVGVGAVVGWVWVRYTQFAGIIRKLNLFLF